MKGKRGCILYWCSVETFVQGSDRDEALWFNGVFHIRG